MKRYAIIVAGGSGSRMNSEIPKQFLLLANKPVLFHTLEAFAAAAPLELILVLPENQISYWERLRQDYNWHLPHQVVAGGDTRFHSVKKGLELVSDPDSLIAVHDGVRPLVTASLINNCFEEAGLFGSAVAAVPLKDSIRAIGPTGNGPLDREAFRLVQTPQAFRSEWMKKAFLADYQPFFTDCASVLEYAGFDIHLSKGDYKNLKITTPEDLALAEVLVGRSEV